MATATQTIVTSLTPIRTATLKAIDVMVATPTAEGSTAPMETAGSSLTTEMALQRHLSLPAAMVPMRQQQLGDTQSLQLTLEETQEGATEEETMVSLAGDQMPPVEEVIDLILKEVGTTTMVEINQTEVVQTTKTRCLISSTKRLFAVTSRSSRPAAWVMHAPSLTERLRKEA